LRDWRHGNGQNAQSLALRDGIQLAKRDAVLKIDSQVLINFADELARQARSSPGLWLDEPPEFLRPRLLKDLTIVDY
jgi:hypothetical protein